MFQSRDWVDVYSGTSLNCLASATTLFQSRDWVDVYSGLDYRLRTVDDRLDWLFQSRDWVDVYSGMSNNSGTSTTFLFQSRDWVDVYSGPPFFRS